VSGEPVAGTAYTWHLSPDGGACFAVPGGGGAYVYVSNSETVGQLGGGAGAIRFAADGTVEDAYRILGDTHINCAGGPTPWGTWLSCEEHNAGLVWECDPFAASQGVARPALGAYAHEAAAVDTETGTLYLTEDAPDGRLYRFVPAAYPELTTGRLDVARVIGRGGFASDATTVDRGRVEWITVSDGPVGAARPRPPDSTAFRGGEGIWWHRGLLVFTTKGDNRVWVLNTRRDHLSLAYDDDLVPGAPLRGVDNVTVSRANEILVAEDGNDLQINVVHRTKGFVGPLLQLVDQPGSEITGPAFGPAGDRLYFSSQRAFGQLGVAQGIGATYEVRGPFRGRYRA
jgi:secreted PhoX family phosphatase